MATSRLMLEFTEYPDGVWCRGTVAFTETGLLGDCYVEESGEDLPTAAAKVVARLGYLITPKRERQRRDV